MAKATKVGGIQLVPQGGAMLAHLGKPNFDAISSQTLSTAPNTATPINGYHLGTRWVTYS